MSGYKQTSILFLDLNQSKLVNKDGSKFYNDKIRILLNTCTTW